MCQYFLYTCVNPNRNKKLPPTKVLLIKPNVFMNVQGACIKEIRDAIDTNITVNRNILFLIYFYVEIKVLCDDLETDIGKVKISLTGGDR